MWIIGHQAICLRHVLSFEYVNLFIKLVDESRVDYWLDTLCWQWLINIFLQSYNTISKSFNDSLNLIWIVELQSHETIALTIMFHWSNCWKNFRLVPFLCQTILDCLKRFLFGIPPGLVSQTIWNNMNRLLILLFRQQNLCLVWLITVDFYFFNYIVLQHITLSNWTYHLIVILKLYKHTINMRAILIALHFLKALLAFLIHLNYLCRALAMIRWQSLCLNCLVTELSGWFAVWLVPKVGLRQFLEIRRQCLDFIILLNPGSWRGLLYWGSLKALDTLWIIKALFWYSW